MQKADGAKENFASRRRAELHRAREDLLSQVCVIFLQVLGMPQLFSPARDLRAISLDWAVFGRLDFAQLPASLLSAWRKT